MSQPFNAGDYMPGTVAGSAVPSPTPVNQTDDLEARVQAMIDARVAGLQSAYDTKIAELEKRHAEELRAARGALSVDHTVPFNAGGPGTENVQVWSQYHQDLANKGELTDEHVRLVTGLPPAERSAA